MPYLEVNNMRRSQENAKHLQAQSTFLEHITKPYLSNYDPLKPHVNIVKLGFLGICVLGFFFFFFFVFLLLLLLLLFLLKTQIVGTR